MFVGQSGLILDGLHYVTVSMCEYYVHCPQKVIKQQQIFLIDIHDMTLLNFNVTVLNKTHFLSKAGMP